MENNYHILGNHKQMEVYCGLDPTHRKTRYIEYPSLKQNPKIAIKSPTKTQQQKIAFLLLVFISKSHEDLHYEEKTQTNFHTSLLQSLRPV